MAKSVNTNVSSSGASAGEPNNSNGGVLNYFSESYGELKKVTTPTRQEAMQASIVTLIIIAFMSLALFFMDFIFNSIVSLLVL